MLADFKLQAAVGGVFAQRRQLGFKRLARAGYFKHLLRVAMIDRLPETIRLRKEATNVNPLYTRGLEEPYAQWTLLFAAHRLRTGFGLNSHRRDDLS